MTFALIHPQAVDSLAELYLPHAFPSRETFSSHSVAIEEQGQSRSQRWLREAQFLLSRLTPIEASPQSAAALFELYRALDRYEFPREKLIGLLDRYTDRDYSKRPEQFLRFNLRPFTSVQFENNASDVLDINVGRVSDVDSRLSAFPTIDSPFGFMLEKDGIPLALVSFHPFNHESLFVKQIQGISYTRDSAFMTKEETVQMHGLQNMDWASLLVSASRLLAQDVGFKNVIVQSAVNNEWLTERKNDGGEHLRLDRGLKMYDQTASSLGFSVNNQGNWVLAM